jgi:pimeloyl-ACP methyl ester carboxylesterase/DNA-binding CsgD family transcriptional regulator
MDQDIRFCELDGRRIAYATVGEGPPLVFAARWVSHLEDEWDDPQSRAFFEELARTHRVVRYDRLGAGLSDRELVGRPSTELEARALGAVLDACGGEPATLFSCSCAGLATVRFASAEPQRVSRIVFFGSFVSRRDVPDVTRASLVEFTRLNWRLAAQMFSGLLLPHGSGDEIAAVTRHLRRSADADAAAAFLELELTADARADLPSLAMPTLVLHRRGDRTVPIGHGRELASLLPNARFVALGGDAHLPWLDDQREVQRALAGFLDDAPDTDANGDSPLSRRESEVLRLVAAGLSNREIASSLVLSEHTVHRHVANILRKLTQSSRAAAAAQATRLGYI